MSWHVDMIFNIFLAPGGEKSFSPLSQRESSLFLLSSVLAGKDFSFFSSPPAGELFSFLSSPLAGED